MSYNYKENLPTDSKQRYVDKLKLARLERCPYKIRGDEWQDYPKEWPPVGYHDLYHYLIKTPGMNSNHLTVCVDDISFLA